MHSHRVPHYGLRKLGIGVTSVLLGTTLYFGANTPVHADAATTTGSDANADVNVTPSSAVANVESGQSVTLGQKAPQSVANTEASQAATAESTAASSAPTSQSAVSSQAAVSSATPASTAAQSSANANSLNPQATSVAPATAAEVSQSDDQTQDQWVDSVQNISLNSYQKSNHLIINDLTSPVFFSINGQFKVMADKLVNGATLNIAEFNYLNSTNGNYSLLRQYANDLNCNDLNLITNDGIQIGKLVYKNISANKGILQL